MGDDEDDDGPEVLSQIGLISAVLMYLDRCGMTMPVPRKMNAVIAAANDMIDALQSPDRPSRDGMGLAAWAASDDTGMSSGHMAFVLGHAAGLDVLPVATFAEDHYPHDPEDFGRCYRLLRAVPELRPHLPAMIGKEWSALVGAWDELERLYEEELPTGKAPKLYARMRSLLGES